MKKVKITVQQILEILKNLRIIVLADNDGTIRNTNSVKDACLDAFCEKEFGSIPDSFPTLPTDIHRRMHGRPMNEIFVAIAAEIYGKSISLDEGQEITLRLNEYIRPEYVGRKAYEGAKEFYSALKAMGIPMYILTGMEDDLVREGLEKNGMGGIFEEILGAPRTKEENIQYVLKKHPGCRILAMGDAMAEYRATMAIPGTIFLAFDFENREARGKRVFPKEVNVLTSYGQEVWDEIEKQLELQ